MKCANKQRDIAKGCLGIELNGYSLEIVGKFCYFGGTIGSRGVAVDIVIVKIKSWWLSLEIRCLFKPIEAWPEEQKADYISHVHLALCCMEVKLGQLKRKLWSD